tara:strand:+ start:492 stop:1244 length:753 start_codon:yes stop_codon:yes gene_type:complete
MEAEILLPTNINEIPLGSYQKFMATYEKKNDEEFLCQKMVEIFCGLRLRDVLQVKWQDVQDITIHLSKVFKEQPKFQRTFTLNDYEFGFIPNLEDITFGEYIDLETNLKSIDTLHKAMAVLYRPVIEKKKDKYLIEEYEGSANYAEVMKFAPLGVALAAKVFFCVLTSELLNSTIQYLEVQMTNKEVMATFQQEINLVNNGAGIKAYMQSLKENLQTFEMSPRYHYTTALPGLLLKSKKEILNIVKCSDN